MKNYTNKSILLLFIPLLFLSFIFLPVPSQEEVAITIEKVSGEVYCLYGEGGNIGILKGENALLVVDSQYAQNADSVLEEIMKFSPKEIRFLINTHYHGDHTGGNPIIGKEAQIISHKNCKDSFLAEIKSEETAESIGIPQKTYEKEMALEVGNEMVRLLHFGPGHTSGDTVVVFERAKGIHAGDLFFNGLPPYIDVEDGSDTRNWILTIEKLAEKYSDYKVIPGHGKVTNMKEFLKFADYLKYLRKQVAAAIKAGKTREQAVESIDLTKFSHIEDRREFLTKKNNIGWIYDEMTKK